MSFTVPQYGSILPRIESQFYWPINATRTSQQGARGTLVVMKDEGEEWDCYCGHKRINAIWDALLKNWNFLGRTNEG